MDAPKIVTYKTLGNTYRIANVYGLSTELYVKFKKAGLPVYESMGGSLNLRDVNSYTKEQIIAIRRLVRSTK